MAKEQLMDNRTSLDELKGRIAHWFPANSVLLKERTQLLAQALSLLGKRIYSPDDAIFQMFKVSGGVRGQVVSPIDAFYRLSQPEKEELRCHYRKVLVEAQYNSPPVFGDLKQQFPAVFVS